MIRIKVCCIQDRRELELAVSAGASAVGLVSEMPSGPGVISETAIRELAEATPVGVDSVLLTSLTEPEPITRQHERTRTSAIQLCELLSPEQRFALKQSLHGIRLIQVVHVTGPEAVERARIAVDQADALLLDTGGFVDGKKELGGTGRTHDWSVSREIVAASSLPVFLAGGLGAANVREAMATVEPYGLDLCSGVRIDNRLDEEQLARFIQLARDLA